MNHQFVGRKDKKEKKKKKKRKKKRKRKRKRKDSLFTQEPIITVISRPKLAGGRETQAQGRRTTTTTTTPTLMMMMRGQVKLVMRFNPKVTVAAEIAQVQSKAHVHALVQVLHTQKRNKRKRKNRKEKTGKRKQERERERERERVSCCFVFLFSKKDKEEEEEEESTIVSEPANEVLPSETSFKLREASSSGSWNSRAGRVMVSNLACFTAIVMFSSLHRGSTELVRRCQI